MLRGIMSVPVSFMRVRCFTIDFPILLHFSRLLFFHRCPPDNLDYMALKVAVFRVSKVELQFNLSG